MSKAYVLQDAKHGTTTWVSAHDRATAVLALASRDSTPGDFNRPGHIFPLKYRDVGVLKRVGHTKASVDLTVLAGLDPMSVMCEIVDDDGSMARLPKLRQFAKRENLIRQIKNSNERRNLGYFSCGTGNPVDDCWRCDPNWQQNRKRLADCGIGFGRNAIGGRDGKFYVVTDPRDDDPFNPRPGTLHHAVIQDRPLWIVFKRDMVIQLKQELIMNSFKTIDGRGENVHISNGACITIQYVTNVIIHGLHIHDCVPTGNAMVRSSEIHFGWRTMVDDDAVFGALILSFLYLKKDHKHLYMYR